MSMGRLIKRRRGERKHGVLIMLQRYAQTIITLALAGGIVYGGVTHFATAADVDKKFKQVTRQISRTDLNRSRERYEDELFRLRQERQTSKTKALIERYQNKLDDANARLRDLENKRR